MVNIIINSDPRYNIDRGAIRTVVLVSLARHKIVGKVELGVNIVGDRKMHQLNKTYRGIDTTTDILSFALEDTQATSLQHIPRVGFVSAPDKVLRLGDIVLSYPQVVEDAALDGISVEEEIRSLLEHGVNHLLGIHHN
ncbi:MAG: rRNA maturation RNase YbeY [Candidatus Daviesbacteria bacterium]|nr:MAG: rRNA maturation RNase YbeY [Candidatus Daviesbacteria bacterium]